MGAAVICLLIFGALLRLRACGWLQRPELMFYDHVVRQRAEHQPAAADPRIVICGMTEDDLIKYGHPLDDAKLADLLEKIAAAGPCVVGVDIYRDLKEPRSGEYYAKLAETLPRLENVIMIERLPGRHIRGIKPPPSLVDMPDRVAPNNLPFDHQIDGIYRRGFLFYETGLRDARECFALTLAHRYLAAHDVAAELVAAPGGDVPLLRLGKTTFPRLTPNAGCYFGLDLQGYEMLVDYRAPQHYRQISFGQVLEGTAPEGAFKDAIVIVGIMTSSVKDFNHTPLNSEIRGPVNHAMIVNQILRSAVDGDPPTRWWSGPENIAWIGLCTLLGGALGLVTQSPWRLAPGLALLLGGIVLAGREALYHALWIPVVTPTMGAFAAATFVTSLVVFLERSDRRAMSALFSRHVSKEVLDLLWAEREQFLDGGRLKPLRVTATVLFTDLKDYTTIAEDMDPAELMNWINEYTDCMAPLVELHGGIVNSYSGDAIMAVFGAPFPHSSEEEIDRDACHAVECALAMRQELKALNTAWAERGMPTVAMRVGIFTGPLVTGSIGSRQRLEYAVLGDTTNTAARLESMGKELSDEEKTEPCTILVGDATWERLRGRFSTRRIGSKRLKGKAKEVIIHSILSAAP